MTEPTTEALPDGAIRVCLGGRCATTSSQHLVPDKVAQLERAPQPPPPAPLHLET